jgi:hypothetical protein
LEANAKIEMCSPGDVGKSLPIETSQGARQMGLIEISFLAGRINDWQTARQKR